MAPLLPSENDTAMAVRLAYKYEIRLVWGCDGPFVGAFSFNPSRMKLLGLKISIT